METTLESKPFQSRIQAMCADILLSAVLCVVAMLSLGSIAWMLLKCGVIVPLPSEFVSVVLVISIVTTVPLLYGGLSESGNHQATKGKRLYGCIVCDNDGKPLSFAKALGRQCYKVLPLFVLGGIVLADYFTSDFITEHININLVYYFVLSSPVTVFLFSYFLTGTALHDRLAGTQVLMLDEDELDADELDADKEDREYPEEIPPHSTSSELVPLPSATIL